MVEFVGIWVGVIKKISHAKEDTSLRYVTAKLRRTGLRANANAKTSASAGVQTTLFISGGEVISSPRRSWRVFFIIITIIVIRNGLSVSE